MEKCGKGVCLRVVAEKISLKNWQDFLHSNETELFELLTKALFVTFYQNRKKIVITDGDPISSKPFLCDPHSLFPCTREEANIRQLLPKNYLALCGHFNVLIRTVDTDVIVLAVCCCLLQHPWVQTTNSG